MSDDPTPTAGGETPPDLPGERSDLAVDDLWADADSPVAERRIHFRCHSGRRIGGTWRGIPALELVERLDPPPDATHLLVESEDGYRACVPMRRALEGLLAVELDGRPLDGPRFVAPGLSGPRSVRDVTRVAARSLDSHESPSDYERFPSGEESGPEA